MCFTCVCLELVSSERSLQYVSLTCHCPIVLEVILLISRRLCCANSSVLMVLCICATFHGRIAKCFNNLSTHEASLAPQIEASPSLIRHRGTGQVRE